MGHCDSSAQLGGNGEYARSDQGAAGSSASHGSPRIANRGQVSRLSPSISSWILLWLLRIYKTFLSPFFGGACKFQPSCSNYAYEAVARYGARRGSLLALKRLLRCRPLTQGGFDPVPDEGESQALPAAPNRLESF